MSAYFYNPFFARCNPIIHACFKTHVFNFQNLLSVTNKVLKITRIHIPQYNPRAKGHKLVIK